MSTPWAPERVISPEQARLLIEAQFPQFAPVSLETLGAGFDNTAFLVNGSHVFRFPRRQLAVSFLEAETRLLPKIAARLPLPVPVPVCVGRPTKAFPWPFAGYPLIPGRTACRAKLNDNERGRVAAPLARFLAALHAIPTSDAAALGAGPDSIARLDVHRRTAPARNRLAELVRVGIIEDEAPFRAILEAAPAEFVPRADTLVHGDLYARHLLVDVNHRLSGVIDWGDVHLGDPAGDLMIAFLLLPPHARDHFRTTYGPIPDETWQVARLRAVWHTTAVLTYAHATEEADLLQESMIAIRNIRSE